MAENFKVKTNFSDNDMWEDTIFIEKIGDKFFAELELDDEDDWEDEEEEQDDQEECEGGVIKLSADSDDELVDKIIDKIEEHCEVCYWVYVAKGNGGVLALSKMY